MQKADEESSGSLEKSKYYSVDPAPPVAVDKEMTTEELKSILLDDCKPLFERYRAMFSLRNRGNEEDVLVRRALQPLFEKEKQFVLI